MWKKLMLIAGVCLTMSLPALARAGTALQQFEPGSLTQIVASHKGKPFVLVVWSLDCEYCQASLQALSQEKRKRQELQVVTLATDSVRDPTSAKLIRKKLAATGMTANAWAFGDAPPEHLRYALDPNWHGEVPRSYWFDARGQSVAYSGVITAEIVTRWGKR